MSKLFIVISAVTNQARTELNGVAVDVVDWLTKPIYQDCLLASINKIFNQAVSLKPKVLHIEDDKNIATYIDVLFKNKINLTAVTTLQAAKNKLNSETYELVILDIHLPDGLGFDLLPVINNLPVAPPVVVFFAYEVDKNDSDYFSEVLIKSHISNDQLFNTINSYLN